MLADWDIIPDNLQLALAREALRSAAETILERAQVFAEEMEDGTLPDCSGPETLRLLAGIVRTNCGEGLEHERLQLAPPAEVAMPLVRR